MRRFLAFIITFAIVYLVTPWVAHQLLNLTVEHPERYTSVGFLAGWGVYSLLRYIFRERLPRV